MSFFAILNSNNAPRTCPEVCVCVCMTEVTQRVEIRDRYKERHCVDVSVCVFYMSIEDCFEATSAGPPLAGGPGMCDR